MGSGGQLVAVLDRLRCNGKQQLADLDLFFNGRRQAFPW